MRQMSHLVIFICYSEFDSEKRTLSRARTGRALIFWSVNFQRYETGEEQIDGAREKGIGIREKAKGN